MLILRQQARNRHVVTGCRTPSTGSGSANRWHGHREHIGHPVRGRDGTDVHVAEMFAGIVVDRRAISERGRFHDRVVHHATVGRSIRGRRTNRIGTRTPNFLKLGRGYVCTIVGGDSSPELLSTSFVDCAKTIGVDDFGLVRHASVDTKGV